MDKYLIRGYSYNAYGPRYAIISDNGVQWTKNFGIATKFDTVDDALAAIERMGYQRRWVSRLSPVPLRDL